MTAEKIEKVEMNDKQVKDSKRGKKSFDKRRQEVFIKSGEYIVKFRNVVQTEEVKAVLDKLIEDFLLDKQQNT